MGKPRIVIVGGGFAGLNAAKSIAKLEVEVTLIDRNNYHLFQPLLYQVATAGLSSVEIAAPIRKVLKRHKNVEVLMAEVKSIDPKENQLIIQDPSQNETQERSLEYDYLILAPGSHYNYFGHEEWAQFAPSLKNIPDALKIRRMVLTAFEQAEMESEPFKQKACLRFVVVGAGPTGVELAGSIAELAHKVLADDFRHINTASAQILLVEAGPKILGPFPEDLSEKAKKKLEQMGVEVKTHTMVEEINEKGAKIGGQFVESRTVLWCAGVLASPLLRTLGLKLDRGGRIPVQTDLSLANYPNVFVLGDAAQYMHKDKPLPGLAPVAIQQGHHIGRVIHSRMKGEPQGPAFHYLDKGTMATVGKSFAVVQVGKLKTAGLLGWLLWLFVHILYLVGFQNRAFVLMQWAWQYFSFDRGARVITQER